GVADLDEPRAAGRSAAHADESAEAALAQRVLVEDLDADLRLLVLGLRGLVDDRLREGLRVEVQGRLVHEVAGVRCGAGDGLRAVQAGLRGGGGDDRAGRDGGLRLRGTGVGAV